MPANRTLYLTPHQIHAFSWRRGHCVAEAVFDASDPGSSFSDYLQANRSSRWTLVANVPEEGFHQETIPYLQSGDRQVVVRRRLDQLFQASPFAVELSLGYEKTRRKDERLLLLGLTNPLQFDPAVRQLLAAESKVSGIYSLPLLSAALLEKLKIPLTRALLISLQDNTIRQTYFDGGRLVFSRVSPLGDSSTQGVAQSTAGEIARFQQYLLSQRMISRSDALDAHVILHGNIAQAVAATLPGHEFLRFHVHDLRAVAKQLGLESDLTDSRSQALFVHLANSAPPRKQFAPPALRKNFHLWQASRAMALAGLVGLAAAMVFSGKSWLDAIDYRSRTASRAAETGTLDSRYQSLVTTFPSVPIAKEALHQVVSGYTAIEKGSRFPRAMLGVLASAMNQHPNVELSRIDWGIGDEMRTRIKHQMAPGSEVLLIEGTIRIDADGSARALLAEFEAFSRKILGEAALQRELLVLQQPFDVTSDSSLKSGAGELSTREPRRFSLALLQRVDL